MTISPGVFNVEQSGGTITIVLETDLQYEVDIPSEHKHWITQIVTKGMDTYHLKFNIAPTKEYESREGEIIIKDIGGGYSDTIKIYQAQKDAILLSQRNVALAEGGGEIEAVIRNNIAFNIRMPEGVNWISRRLKSRKVFDNPS